MTSCESASLTSTECKMKSRIMTAMVTAVVPLEEVPLEVAAVVVYPGEVEDRWCVTIVTKLAIGSRLSEPHHNLSILPRSRPRD